MLREIDMSRFLKCTNVFTTEFILCKLKRIMYLNRLRAEKETECAFAQKLLYNYAEIFLYFV
jgi:hypothetical protein